jgi:hypothetical protein
LTRDEIIGYLRRDSGELSADTALFEAFVSEWADLHMTIGDPFVFVGIAWDWFRFGWYARATHDGYS